MKASFTFSLALFFLAFLAHAAPLGQESFYLGLNPSEKKAIIQDFLSDKGKLYPIGNDTAFVRDSPEVLKTIRDFLDNPDLEKKDNIRISFLRHKQRSEQSTEGGIHFELGKDFDNGKIVVKGGKSPDSKSPQIEHEGELGSVGVYGSTSTQKTNSDNQFSVLTISGSPAFLEISTQENELTYFRHLYEPKLIEDTYKDGLELKVTPTFSGKNIQLTLNLQYWVRDQHKKKAYSLEDLQTQVVLKKGQWMELSGLSTSSQLQGSELLNLSKKTLSDILSLWVKADIVPSGSLAPKQ